MGVNLTLSPQLEQEIRLREKYFAANAVERIFRYGAPVGFSIEHHPRLERCMELAKQRIYAAERNNHSIVNGSVIIADRLSKGQGRFQRSWYAPEGNLYLSLTWVDTLLPEFTRLLPLAIGTACCETLLSFIPAARLKWVNDVLVHGRKIAGILTETLKDKRSGERCHLIGIGINCNSLDFPAELRATAISLAEVLDEQVDTEEVFSLLLHKLRWNIGLLYYQEELALAVRGIPELTEQLSPLVVSAWRRLSDTVGRRVVYGYDLETAPLYEARAIRVEDDGGLCLELADKSRLIEYSGEIRYLDAD